MITVQDIASGDEDGDDIWPDKCIDETAEEWPVHVERLEHYLTTNGIGDAGKKQAILLSVISVESTSKFVCTSKTKRQNNV